MYEEVEMFIAPWEVCLLAASALGVFYLFAEFWKELIATIIVGGGAIVLGGYTVKYFFEAVTWYLDRLPGKSEEERKRAVTEKAKRELEREKEVEKRKSEKFARAVELQCQRDKQYQGWLAKNYSLGQKTEKVNLLNLPVPLAKKERVAQVFRVSFWALKAKIYRPYSR